MDWKEKILEGMKLIKEGCKENTFWGACEECPFDTYCTSIMQDSDDFNFQTPDEWQLKD